MTFKCWMCNKMTGISDDNYGDHRCPHCGVQITVYPPDGKEEHRIQPLTTEDVWMNQTEEKPMGKLADRAKQKSPFIKLAIGESIIMRYKAWKETTNNFGDETFRYFFDYETENGIVTKHFDNMSEAFAVMMDEIPFGTLVRVTRKQKIDRNGAPVEGKSVWSVEVAQEE